MNPGVLVVTAPSGVKMLHITSPEGFDACFPVPLHSEGLAGALGLDADERGSEILNTHAEQLRRNRDCCNAINEIRRQHLGLWPAPLSPTAQEIVDDVIEREGHEGFARRVQADLDDYHHVAELSRRKWTAR
jgi:hypothetical protein